MPGATGKHKPLANKPHDTQADARIPATGRHRRLTIKIPTDTLADALYTWPLTSTSHWQTKHLTPQQTHLAPGHWQTPVIERQNT
jgi:hypothetical protein